MTQAYLLHVDTALAEAFAEHLAPLVQTPHSDPLTRDPLTRDPTAWSSWTWMDIASDSISALACKVPDAATYGAVTWLVFEDGVNFGRLYAWHLFSRRIYARLSGTERTKMNATCYQTRWTLFKRCDYRIKCFLVILWLFE